MRRERCTVQIVAAVMIVLMSATTFITQRQLMSKNMPADAMNNPFAQQQKILLYVFPLVFAVSGVNFPIGVLLYWLTTNLWSMGQQFYVIRRNPLAGLAGLEALERRRRPRRPRRRERSRAAPGPTARVPTRTRLSPAAVRTAAPPRPGQRQQPKRTKRRSSARPWRPAAAAVASRRPRTHPPTKDTMSNATDRDRDRSGGPGC